MLYHFLYPLHESIGFFRVFRYISFRTAAAILTSLFICFILGPYLIKLLSRKQIGQVVREDGPQTHLKKAGTPTMGGILIILSVTLSTLLWAKLDNIQVWTILVAFLGMGSVGFLDDYIKLHHNKKGLTPGQKLKMQLGVAMATIVMLIIGSTGSAMVDIWNTMLNLPFNMHEFNTQIYLPFFKRFSPDIGWWYILWMLLVIIGSTNAVNLTDGLDGLAIGPVMISAVTFLILSYVSGHAQFADYLYVAHIQNGGELAIFCGTLFGASLGFLWYNTYPAQVFMGDVGALAMGSALGMVALVIKQEIIWIIVGGIFVMETLSVIMQVLSFKMTGKRIFKMAPLHHHFELKGWAEPKVIVRFWIISIILSLIALSSIKLR